MYVNGHRVLFHDDGITIDAGVEYWQCNTPTYRPSDEEILSKIADMSIDSNERMRQLLIWMEIQRGRR
jgi:hypothetical protein